MAEPIYLLSINSGGIAELSDKTRWRLAPMELRRTSSWMSGDTINVVHTDHPLWPWRVHHLGRGESIGAIEIKPLPGLFNL